MKLREFVDAIKGLQPGGELFVERLNGGHRMAMTIVKRLLGVRLCSRTLSSGRSRIYRPQ